MINTFELLIIIYLIIGFMRAINFIYTENEKKTSTLGVIIFFGVFVMLLWPFGISYNNTNA